MKIKEKMHINKKWNLVVSPAYLACGAVVIYLISLLPILILSFYCHPSADDFNYGVKTHLAVMSGQGICGIIRAALETVCENYTSWQGTFSAIFFFSLQPGVFSESAVNCKTKFHSQILKLEINLSKNTGG